MVGHANVCGSVLQLPERSASSGVNHFATNLPAMIQEFKSAIFRSKLWHSAFKNRGELRHWKQRKQSILKWYRGERSDLFPFPTASERVCHFDEVTNAFLTFIKVETLHASYLKDLLLRRDAFRGMRVADIGSGPFPTLLVFEDCERYCIDHLMTAYEEMGFPLKPFKQDVHFVHAKSENLPLPQAIFDAVVSRNALDHVDDFARTASEILRLLKPGGVLHILVNYHEPTPTEPHVLSDAAIQEHLGSVGVRKISEVEGAWGFRKGRTVLWSNAPQKILAME